MYSALSAVARFFGASSPSRFAWTELRYQHVHACKAWLAQRYAPKTANRHLSAVRGVLRQAWMLELLPGEEYHRAVSVESIKGSRVKAGRCLTDGERLTLFRACDLNSLRGARDAAILSFLYGCGLRRAELVGLNVADVAGAVITVRLGKGNKGRRVYLPAGGVRALDAWLGHRGTDAGALFFATCGGRYGTYRLIRRRLCSDSVREILLALSKRTGVAPFTPHDVRRTFIGDLLDAGLDAASIQQLAGHASLETTGEYDRRPERARARSAELLTIPL